MKYKRLNMKKYLISIVLLAAISACNNKIGEYVYLEVWDDGDKLHIDKQCPYISKNHMVEFVKVKEWANEHTKNDVISLCPKCISDKDAETLKSFITDTTSIYY